MNSNAFSIDLTEEFETATELGVQLLIERNSENIAGKYIKVKYLGEYPYTITDVSADDGITITLTENFDADGEVKAYVAVYTGNKLDAADIIDVTSTTLTSDVEFNSQTQTLKVFIWNENLKPVAQQVSPEFAAEAGQNF